MPKCLQCGKPFDWLPNKWNREGCNTCGICQECLDGELYENRIKKTLSRIYKGVRKC